MKSTMKCVTFKQYRNKVDNKDKNPKKIKVLNNLFNFIYYLFI